jgi:hypothetical protein
VAALFAEEPPNLVTINSDAFVMHTTLIGTPNFFLTALGNGQIISVLTEKPACQGILQTVTLPLRKVIIGLVKFIVFVDLFRNQV